MRGFCGAEEEIVDNGVLCSPDLGDCIPFDRLRPVQKSIGWDVGTDRLGRSLPVWWMKLQQSTENGIEV